MGLVRCFRMLFVAVLLWIGSGQWAPAAPLSGEPAQALSSDRPDSARDRVVRERAVLEPVVLHEIRSESGRSATVLFLVPEGKVVEEGTLLAELDAAPLVAELQQQRVRVVQAESQLAATESALPGAREEAAQAIQVAEQALHVAKGALTMFTEGEYPLQVVTAENELAIASERHSLAAARVEALQAAEGPDGQGPLLEAKLTLIEIKAQLQAAEHRLRFIRDFARVQKAAELNLAIAQRQLEMLRAKNEWARIGREGEATLAAARAGFTMEADKLERIEKEIAACRIHAPRAGTVTYPADLPGQGGAADAPIRPGVVVRSGQPIVSLVDAERFKLAVQVSLEVAQTLQTGQSASIGVEALPQRTFEGRITEMCVLPASAGEPVDALVTVRVDDPTGALRAGMSATVVFEP